MNKFQKICKKIAGVLEYIIGISLAICIFVGGLGFIGYVVALCVGGETATAICTWLYKSFYGILIKLATYTTLLSFVLIYARGDAKWINPVKYWKNKIVGEQK